MRIPDVASPGQSLDIEQSAPLPAVASDPDPYLFGTPTMRSQTFPVTSQGQSSFVLPFLPVQPDTLQVFLNGVLMYPVIDYNFSVKTITLVNATTNVGDMLLARWQ